jgi:predicted AAA+ superfamily ATPase
LLSVKQSLETTNEQVLKQRIEGYDLVAIDEAQNVINIGQTLKIIHDVFPEIQVIATGSSSFDLANKTGEPLVGRSRSFILYPFSVKELMNAQGAFVADANLENFLRLGMYPCIYGMAEEEARDELENLVNGYLYKDILAFENIKHSSQILKLLQCLALQIGSEVSFNELSGKLAISANTVKKYVDLLEKCYVIFTLPAFSRNLRNEIAGNRTRKIFFYDVGIRNALIGNYQNMNLRNDVGGIWENFCVVERMKKAQRERRRCRTYFWRNYDDREIDFIEEEDGKLEAYEFKYSPNKRAKLPKIFKETYGVSDLTVINKENWLEYL